MITKSKIKIYNNKRNYIKRKGGDPNGEQPESTSKVVESQEKTHTETESQGNNKITIEQLNNKVKECINTLIEGLTKKKEQVKELNFDQEDPKKICEALSDLNLNGEFNKELYSLLNNYFTSGEFKDKDIDIRGHKLLIGGNLNQLVYSKIINGKISDDTWPGEKQKKLLKDSMSKSTFSRMKSGIGSMFKLKKEKDGATPEPIASTAPAVELAQGAEGAPKPANGTLSAEVAEVAKGAEGATPPKPPITPNMLQNVQLKKVSNNNKNTTTGGRKIVKRKRKYFRKNSKKIR